MKKIIFKVTNVWEYTNGKTGETFKKLQLIHEGKPFVKNGCDYTPKTVAYHTASKCTLSVGDDFIYDDSYMTTSDAFIREDGSNGVQLNIRLRKEL
jgi:hypothetical protein